MLKLSEKNIRLVSLKKAEDETDAIVLRFSETEGKETECTLRLFFSPTGASYADNAENTLAEIEDIKGDTLRFTIKPYSYATLKIYGNFNIY